MEQWLEITSTEWHPAWNLVYARKQLTIWSESPKSKHCNKRWRWAFNRKLKSGLFNVLGWKSNRNTLPSCNQLPYSHQNHTHSELVGCPWYFRGCLWITLQTARTVPFYERIYPVCSRLCVTSDRPPHSFVLGVLSRISENVCSRSHICTCDLAHLVYELGSIGSL